MFDFLKKLFGGSKEEEQGDYIPQEYIIPKKTKPTEEIKNESPFEEPLVVTFSAPESIELFDEKLATVEKTPTYSIEEDWETFDEDGKTGFKDENGDKIIAAKYDSVTEFINGRCIVESKNKYGMINNKGQYLILPTYDTIDDEKEGLYRLEKDGKYGFARTDGSIAIPVQYLDTGEVSEGLIWVEHEKGMVGFIDKEGKNIIDFIFDYCGDFSEGLASATQYAQEEGQEDYYGFIDKKGNFVINMGIEDSGDFKEGLAPVCIDDKYGYINKKGELICQPIYASAGNFVQGLSCVQTEENGNYGYADKTGKLVIPCNFKESSEYMEGEELNEFISNLKQKFFIK
jgi:hypothetical protein